MRTKIVKNGLLIIMAVIVVRLFFIQVIEKDEWMARADAQQTMQETLKAKRGEIYMMAGSEPKAVVMNETVYTVIIDPKTAWKKKNEAQQKLVEILGDMVTADWNKVWSNEKSRYAVIAKEVPRVMAEKIAEADVTGVWLQENTKRVYPEGELGASILGFVNAEGEGQYGVEGAMNEELAGKDGILKTVKDINNVALSIGNDNVRVPAVNGDNIVLTIDRNMQAKVEQVLAETTKSMGKTNASAVVLDPNTGKVLAMADFPSYDPANYKKVTDASLFTNDALMSAYEPASVCKTFTFAAAINEGVMTPESTYTNRGLTEVDGWEIHNAEQGQRGVISMQTAYNYSLNTGSMQALMWMGGNPNAITATGRERLYDYFHERFGLAKATGIELLEVQGQMTEPNEKGAYGLNATYANMTFGQNMQVTMIQVAAAFSAVVNGGHYYTPYIVAGTVNEDGKFMAKEQKTAEREVLSESTSEQMRGMLYGTRRAWRASGVDPAGYYIGGKTGTAQTIKNGKYDSSDTVATYVGFGGTEGEKPAYVIMVRISKPGTYSDGQKQALPLFNAIKAVVQDELEVKPAG